MTKEELLAIKIDEARQDIYYEVKRCIDNIPKPVDGLGKFEDLVCKLASAQHNNKPDIAKKALIVMCADNGVLEEGVTEMGGYMTGLTAKKMAEGESSVCYMAKIAGIKVIPVDIGINGDVNAENLVVNKIAKGTKNFLKEPAMTEEETLKAIEAGIKLVEKLKNEGTGIICTGDMGIGNTTTAVALICAILEGDPAVLTGRNTGMSNAIYHKKMDVIAEAIHKYGYDGSDLFSQYERYDDPDMADTEASRIVGMVSNLGGLDIAGLIGVFIGGAMYHVPVVVDGITPAAAALAANNIIPGCGQYMVGSHFGKEPATEIVFQELELDPVINADMAMGEGVGAVMLMPMLDMVVSVINNLGTEEEASI